MMSGDRNGACALTDSPDRRLGTNRFVPDVSPFIDPARSPLLGRLGSLKRPAVWCITPTGAGVAPAAPGSVARVQARQLGDGRTVEYGTHRIEARAVTRTVP